MQIENNLYNKFKPYKAYRKANTREKKINFGPLLGAAIGACTAMYATSKMFKKPIFGTKEGLPVSTFQDVTEMLLMSGMANLGGVVGGSIGKKSPQIKKKLKEAGFQIMNMSIPMLLVTAAIKTCEASKTLNKVPTKIISSFTAMTSGAVIATMITNIGKKPTERRKYTIKDSLANFDDIIATIKIGFRKITEYVPVDKILPFIYIYNGYRSGNKE